jgi:type-F conjugative transfer system pilin assembly protein TrbC
MVMAFAGFLSISATADECQVDGPGHEVRPSDVLELHERGRTLATELKERVNPAGPRVEVAEKAADQAFQKYSSDEYQEQVDFHREWIRQKMLEAAGIKGGEETETRRAADKKASAKACLSTDESIYVFISSSMPMMTLRNYATDIARLQEKNVRMILRGFIGSMQYFGPTRDFTLEVLVKDLDCLRDDQQKYGCVGISAGIDIDPNLTRAFGIEMVPAVVYRKGSEVELQTDEDAQYPEDGFYVVYGDATLRESLREINRQAKQKSLDRLIDKLEGVDEL